MLGDMAKHRAPEAGRIWAPEPVEHEPGWADLDVAEPVGSAQWEEEPDWEDPPGPAPLWRARVAVPAVLLLAVLAGTWWLFSWLTGPAGPVGDQEGAAPGAVQLDAAAPPGDEPPGQTSAQSGSGTGAPGSAGPGSPATPGAVDEVIVHVVGEVHRPGIVRLAAGSRVVDALELAGGATEDAQLQAVNLAAPVADGAQILVPGPGDASAAAGAPGDGAPGPVDGAGVGSPGGTVNVNTADATALDGLPGIGPALAQRIIDHREGVGPFGSLEDLGAVSGIGPKMLEKLDGQISW